MAESDGHVPYQAYRSKRHSSSRLTPTNSPSRPTSFLLEKDSDFDFGYHSDITQSPITAVVPMPNVPVEQAAFPATNSAPEPASAEASIPHSPAPSEHISLSSTPPSAPASPLPSSSARPAPATKRNSTFRRVPRASRSPLPVSPLSPQSHTRHASTSSIPHVEPNSTPAVELGRNNRMTSFSSILVPDKDPIPPPTPPKQPAVTMPEPNYTAPPATPPPRTSSLHVAAIPTPPTSPPPSRASQLSPSPSAQPEPQTARYSVPYRPGFQPQGVRGQRTDDFLAARRLARDGEPSLGQQKRVERAKLERRLEKLIQLHFPLHGQQQPPKRPSENRRASSFFDIDFKELKRMNLSDAGDLWKGVLTSNTSAKDDTRSAEQRITPWEEDSTVKACPICTTSFHPITNRKHHCRLCGSIICSLPIKRPHRPAMCSLLFVVDSNTRQIEEVGEGVDYGVKKRRNPSIGSAAALNEKAPVLDDEAEKFLKGVRICRNCRPVLLRQQYRQETTAEPAFNRLYDAFITLEKELEDSLPRFQELILSLNQDENPSKEAVSTRKRLLEIFGQYDALSKRIRKLPCPSGSSQDRVQAAVMTRANLFLQEHMFPLQTLPKATSRSSAKAKTLQEKEAGAEYVDLDSEMAKTLQPLLEQEALLESFVQEATAARKFEDAKTLRINLKEIRAEIERIVNESDIPRQEPKR